MGGSCKEESSAVGDWVFSAMAGYRSVCDGGAGFVCFGRWYLALLQGIG